MLSAGLTTPPVCRVHSHWAGEHRLVLPFALPLTAALLVLLGTALWSQLTAHQRLMLLERDMLTLQQDAAAVREALVLRETRSETLQEDLAVARAAVNHSTAQHVTLTQAAEELRTQLLEVQRQEEEARSKLQELEKQLHSLQAATSEPLFIGDAELDELRGGMPPVRHCNAGYRCSASLP